MNKKRQFELTGKLLSTRYTIGRGVPSPFIHAIDLIIPVNLRKHFKNPRRGSTSTLLGRKMREMTNIILFMLNTNGR